MDPLYCLSAAIVAVLLCAVSPDPIAADSSTRTVQSVEDSQRAARNLKVLREKLQRFEKEVRQQQTKRDREQHELIEIEKEIGAINLKQQATKVKLDAGKKQRSALRARYQKSERQLLRRKDVVRQWTRAGYALGKQSFLKVLMTQAEPDTLVRTVSYYGYLARAQNTRIVGLTESLTELREVDKALQQATQELADLRDIQATTSSTLQEKRNKRGRIVARLNQAIRTNETTLIGLRADEQQLLLLLNTVATVRSTREQHTTERFDTLRGKLPLPTQGTITARFGDERPFGDSNWDGLLFQAPVGTDFHAVADGEVVFADWFRGYGLLIIIDHGNGFMSVYSHGDTLARDLGDRVTAGDVIGTVGITGGLTTPGLYFAIRHNGKPIDPLTWVNAG